MTCCQLILVTYGVRDKLPRDGPQLSSRFGASGEVGAVELDPRSSILGTVSVFLSPANAVAAPLSG